MTQRDANVLVSVEDFLALVREHPHLFPRAAIAARGRLHKATVYKLVNTAPNPKAQIDPKLSTLLRVAHGCGAQLFVQMPVSTARDLQSNTPSRD